MPLSNWYVTTETQFVLIITTFGLWLLVATRAGSTRNKIQSSLKSLRPMVKWGIGVDIEELDKVREAISNKSFVTRAFTKREVEYSISRGNLAIHYAGIFAAKEAVYKALSSIFSQEEMVIDMTSLEILHARSGAPIVRLKKSSNKFRRLEIKVTISHSSTHAIAVAFARQVQRKI